MCITERGYFDWLFFVHCLIFLNLVSPFCFLSFLLFFFFFAFFSIVGENFFILLFLVCCWPWQVTLCDLSLFCFDILLSLLHFSFVCYWWKELVRPFFVMVFVPLLCVKEVALCVTLFLCCFFVPFLLLLCFFFFFLFFWAFFV